MATTGVSLTKAETKTTGIQSWRVAIIAVDGVPSTTDTKASTVPASSRAFATANRTPEVKGLGFRVWGLGFLLLRGLSRPQIGNTWCLGFESLGFGVQIQRFGVESQGFRGFRI